MTALLKQEIGGYDPQETVLYACGPGPMVRALGDVLKNTAFACQVSLEERMACGLGACLGCAVAVQTEAGRSAYQRVCKEGPVFDLRRIITVFMLPKHHKEKKWVQITRQPTFIPPVRWRSRSAAAWC